MKKKLNSSKSKIKQWEKPENLSKITEWCENGLTMEEVASNIGIGTSTLYAWCHRSPIINETLKDARDVAVCKVENALYELCMKGNVTAMIFFLKNRRPEEWKDRRETDNTNTNKDVIEIKL